jgi:hypothetical protein
VTNDDELRARLARLDPVPASIPVDPPTSPRAQDLLERAMLTTEQIHEPPVAAPRWRRPAVLAAAAVAVVALGVAALLTGGGGSSPAKHRTTLALQAPAPPRPGMNACVRFTVDLLREKPVAFGGTVTSVSPGLVTLDVDHWYKGGSADVVTVAVPDRNTAVGTIEMVQGKRYLVSAMDGTVVTCGYSGEATPDLEAAYAQAFTP